MLNAFIAPIGRIIAIALIGGVVLVASGTPISHPSEGASSEIAPKEDFNTNTEQEIENLKQEIAELKKQQDSDTKAIEQSVNKFSPPIKPVQKEVITPKVESWQEVEARYFAEAAAKGWSFIIMTNSQGQKRYYRKEGNLWVRKNTEAEALATYIPPQQITRQCLAEGANSLNKAISEIEKRDEQYTYLSLADKTRLLSQRLSNYTNALYTIRFICGTVTTEEQLIYELERIRRTVEEALY